MKLKNNSILYILLVAGALGCISCKREFLEITPKGSLIAEKTSDYNALYNNMMLSASAESTLYLADDVCSLLPTYTSNSVLAQRLFTFADDLYDEDETPNMISIWLKSIYSMNKIVHEVMDSKGGTEAEKRGLLAEARASRALLHFYLVNLYGQPYNEATAATDLGFPIIDTYDLTRKDFERHTVAQVYDFVCDELKASLTDLPGKISHRYRMSAAAANAYLGRVLVYRGRYAEARPYLEAALEGAKNASIPVGLFDYHVETKAGGAYAPGLFGPTVVDANNFKEGMHVMPFSISTNLIFFSASYYIPKAVIDEYTPSDLRRVFLTYTNYAQTKPFANGMARIFGRTNSFFFGANISDVNLLLAEVYTRENKLEKGAGLLVDFRKNRMDAQQANVATGIGQKELLHEIIKERKLEFLGIGDRWFTIRRLSVDPLFPEIANYKHVLYNADGTVSKEYPLRKQRLTMRLPLKMMLENPGMPQND
ncbi:RagB/SusD family nutrient uptake outer membrane protein [Sphingobacterium faecale]|uniref:RagB/SusD family nutrient uptake outer membrane protein n=1 Tax=Sphingobacterium faecale TaxID=2803775 RepID=A0ABS1R9C1_9SPHI|nr:RagB/SusD family nutrient uptake outer membrane protein [Sphingobacterium faecale]MBL1410829.1 RagB/SusD family nutrient uptake outer membrane protein [Sphingobacterium faecale]